MRPKWRFFRYCLRLIEAIPEGALQIAQCVPLRRGRHERCECNNEATCPAGVIPRIGRAFHSWSLGDGDKNQGSKNQNEKTTEGSLELARHAAVRLGGVPRRGVQRARAGPGPDRLPSTACDLPQPHPLPEGLSDPRRGANDEIISRYEYSKGKYVEIEPEESISYGARRNGR